ncbi:MAG: CRISPR-associated endonuclease Cas1, partial [Gemmatimonadetes bacterium]|nr:CRISPR-associated endonuclease Cas1 [Gemmatimonadota bacterium]
MAHRTARPSNPGRRPSGTHEKGGLIKPPTCPINRDRYTNAILNYLYTILEAEARIACRTMGLDPGLGVLHSDQPARDSLA